MWILIAIFHLISFTYLYVRRHTLKSVHNNGLAAEDVIEAVWNICHFPPLAGLHEVNKLQSASHVRKINSQNYFLFLLILQSASHVRISFPFSWQIRPDAAYHLYRNFFLYKWSFYGRKIVFCFLSICSYPVYRWCLKEEPTYIWYFISSLIFNRVEKTVSRLWTLTWESRSTPFFCSYQIDVTDLVDSHGILKCTFTQNLISKLTLDIHTRCEFALKKGVVDNSYEVGFKVLPWCS